MSKTSNEEILTALTLDTKAWIKHWLPEINDNQAKMLIRYINGLLADEVERYADYLSDVDEEAAFEYEWSQYAYKRVREIHAE